MANTNPPGTAGGSVMDLYITSDVNTEGTVSVADGSFTLDFDVTANQVTIVSIPGGEYLANAGKSNKGIHITAIKPVAIYAHIFADNSSGATLLLPVNVLGKDYQSINYTQKANESAASAFIVIATEDNTTVEITPSANSGIRGTPVGTPFTVTLNKGQLYQGLAATDLTGTRIRSISSVSGVCTKIAVFSGSSRIQIGCNPAENSSDNLFQQVYPTATWGKNYITVPLVKRNYDIFRIILSDPNTTVQLNGKLIDKQQFAGGVYYEFNSQQSNVITADKPIQVVQYAVSQGNNMACGVDDTDVGDPEMIYLSPLEQTVDHVTLFSAKNYLILKSYINVIIKTVAAPTFVLDGKPYSGFSIVSNNPLYSYAQISVSQGPHTISAGDGFNAIAYGFGQNESYGYSAGANLQDLNTYISLQNPLNNALQANGCTGINYNVQLTLPYQTSSIKWDLQDGSTPIQQNNPAISGSTTNGTQTLYTYKYPKSSLDFSKGSYSMVATVFNPVADECGSAQQVELDFKISDPPVAQFKYANNHLGDSTQFIDQTTAQSYLKTWSWDFGDGQTAVVENPLHHYAEAGTYDVSLTVTDVDGCTSTYKEKVFVPIAASSVAGSISACAGSALPGQSVGQMSVSGSGLAGDLVITPPPGFSLSLNKDDGYSNKISLTPLSGQVKNTLIYVALNTAASPAKLSGNIVLSSIGLTTQFIPVSGTISALPIINPITNTAQTVSNGKTTSEVNFTGTTNVFNWINNSPQIGLPASGSGNIMPFTAINKTSKAITATVTVIPQNPALAYIANLGSNNVSVFNTATNALVTTIPVGTSPSSVTLSPDESQVYVSNFSSGSISVIDVASNTVTSTITAGENPLGMAISPDGSKLYVVNEYSNKISIIDTKSNNITGTFITGENPNYLLLSTDGNTLFVTNNFGNSLSVINTKNDQATLVPVGNSPVGIAKSSDGKWIYVANAKSNTVSVIDASTYKIFTTVNVGNSPAGITVNGDGSYIYVSNKLSDNISVISTKDYSVTYISTGSAPSGVSLNADGSLLYVVNEGSRTVSIISTANDKVTATKDVGSNPVSIGNFITRGNGCDGLPAKITITVTPTEFPGTISAVNTLTPLSTTYGTSSGASSFTVSGKNIKTGILIVPPDGFEVSVDGVDFNKTITISGDGPIASTTVYLRIASSAPAGTYNGNITLSSTDAASTNLLIPDCTVAAAPLIITADNKKKIYDTPNPPLTVSYNGFVNNDHPSNLTFNPLIVTTATISSPIGTYPITASGDVSPNYIPKYMPGTLTISPLPPNIAIPNAFTPNDDNINDTWEIKNITDYPNCTVKIYNRYGENVFNSIGYLVSWDGKFKGHHLPTGTYYYIIDLRNGNGVVSGWVAIFK